VCSCLQQHDIKAAECNIVARKIYDPTTQEINDDYMSKFKQSTDTEVGKEFFLDEVFLKKRNLCKTCKIKALTRRSQQLLQIFGNIF